MKPLKLALYFLLALTACQFNADQSAKTNSVLNPVPILNLIRYDRDGIERWHLLRPEEIDWIIEKRDSVTMPELGLVAYLFQWGGGLGGPKKRILCYRKQGDKFQREFYFEGEYPMLDEDLTYSQGHALGLQLSQLALELGPEVYGDSIKMEKLLLVTFEKLLKRPPVQLSTLDSISNGTLKFAQIYNYIPSSITKDSLECFKTLEIIRQEMAQNKKGAYYFQGEYYNGIWRGQIVRGHKDKYYIHLKYLNSKCAFFIWL